MYSGFGGCKPWAEQGNCKISLVLVPGMTVILVLTAFFGIEMIRYTNDRTRTRYGYGENNWVNTDASIKESGAFPNIPIPQKGAYSDEKQVRRFAALETSAKILKFWDNAYAYTTLQVTS